ncbi:hypothetical protein HAX54_028397 [Datura stramonium]|uniref:Uncharacterized protein n=1 Tax=Datura stramonium TaxID=4076 RepID=A0ABS8S9J3_DATST|nr:hypothetical protein [Datura stramonium]
MSLSTSLVKDLNGDSMLFFEFVIDPASETESPSREGKKGKMRGQHMERVREMYPQYPSQEKFGKVQGKSAGSRAETRHAPLKLRGYFSKWRMLHRLIFDLWFPLLLGRVLISLVGRGHGLHSQAIVPQLIPWLP